jgi:hypothetical protein
MAENHAPDRSSRGMMIFRPCTLNLYLLDSQYT